MHEGLYLEGDIRDLFFIGYREKRARQVNPGLGSCLLNIQQHRFLEPQYLDQKVLLPIQTTLGHLNLYDVEQIEEIIKILKPLSLPLQQSQILTILNLIEPLYH